MDYLEAIALLKEIETKYDVMSVKYRGLSIWPWLRIYLCDSLTPASKRQTMSSSNVKLVLQTLFPYGPSALFHKHKVWLFSSLEGRKLIGDKYLDYIAGGITELEKTTLAIEWPDGNRLSIPKENLEDNYMLSASWLLMFSHGLETLFRVGKFKIEREDILHSIIEHYKVQIDYPYLVRYLFAQKITMDWILRISTKPKVAFFLCPCTSMGFIWSLHNHGIPIVEMQHGVLNKSHYAYNSLFHSDIFYPDHICVFGEDEYKYFTNDNPVFCKKVTQTGSFILEKSKLFFEKDIFKEYRNTYSRVIVVAGQMGYEDTLSVFVDKIAKLSTDTLFVYIPRHPDVELKIDSPNVIVKKGVNIYEYLKWCDIHMTISSTTCMESQFFYKPTIFYNYQNRPFDYYGKVFSERNGAFFINDPDEFARAIDEIKKEAFVYRDIFAHGHMELIKNVLNEYLNDK